MPFILGINNNNGKNVSIEVNVDEDERPFICIDIKDDNTGEIIGEYLIDDAVSVRDLQEAVNKAVEGFGK